MFQFLESVVETEIHLQNKFSTMVEIKIHSQKICISVYLSSFSFFRFPGFKPMDFPQPEVLDAPPRHLRERARATSSHP